MIKNFFNWLSESNSKTLVYTWQSFEFLQHLVVKGKIKASGEFISMTFDKSAGEFNNFGDVCIAFLESDVFNSDAIAVDYEDISFWKKNPKILKYVSGFSSLKDFVEDFRYQFDYPEDEEIDAADGLSIMYGDEQEILIKTIDLKKCPIQYVSSKKFDRDLQEFCSLHSIEFK